MTFVYELNNADVNAAIRALQAEGFTPDEVDDFLHSKVTDVSDTLSLIGYTIRNNKLEVLEDETE